MILWDIFVKHGHTRVVLNSSRKKELFKNSKFNRTSVLKLSQLNKTFSKDTPVFNLLLQFAVQCFAARAKLVNGRIVLKYVLTSAKRKKCKKKNRRKNEQLKRNLLFNFRSIVNVLNSTNNEQMSITKLGACVIRQRQQR